ncbi:MAG: cobalamin-binding protein [Rhodocyclales bacterium]|nr:cobalamin-binding protein [Rhodocyclales bacterium]
MTSPTAALRTLAACAGLAFCAAAHADVSVRDDLGNTVKLARPAQRIVSLAPHMTETLFAAGAGAQVVGTVDYSDYPEAARKITRVGGYSRLDLEAIAAMKPDLVVGWQSGNAAAHIEKLKGLGYPLYISQPNRIEDVASEIERLGTLAGTGATAAAEARRFRERLAGLRAQYSGKATVRTFYQIWKQPLMTVGKNQIISDAIRLCSGENVFGTLEQMAPTVTVEAVIAANPETIVASGMGDSRPEWLDDWKKWTGIDAVKRDNLFFVPPELIQRHTPRLLEGTERLCQHLETVRERRRK